MTRDEIISMARTVGYPLVEYDSEPYIPPLLAVLLETVAASERKKWPNLDLVINWLENGCDPKEAAKELRLYADAIRARGSHVHD